MQVNIESHELEMIERMTALLPSERQQFSKNILPRRESFEVLYHLHFDNLCADFQEDIRFKFSLGFTALMKRFMNMGKKQKFDLYGNSIPRGVGSPGSPQTPTNEYTQPQDELGVGIGLMSKVAIGALTSQGKFLKEISNVWVPRLFRNPGIGTKSPHKHKGKSGLISGVFFTLAPKNLPNQYLENICSIGG